MTKKQRDVSPEEYYQTKSSRNIVIALEGLNFFWDESETEEVAEMWRRGIPIEMIASSFARDEYEVIVLLLHLARKGRIQKRKGGIWGGLNE